MKRCRGQIHKKSAMKKSKITVTKRRRFFGLVAILLFASIGAWVLSFGNAATPSSPTANASCGATVTPYNYLVPFGQAVWNQPVCNLAKYSKSSDYANRFIDWAHMNDGVNTLDQYDGIIGVSPGFPENPTLFDPDGLANLFTREVYLASKATSEKQVMITASGASEPSNLDGIKYNSTPNIARPGYESNLPEAKIPWNSNWKTGMGGDNEIIIIDDRPGITEGRIYTIWGYNAGGCMLYSGGRVCGMSIKIGRGHDGNIIDYRTHEGYVSERGVGLSYYATLTTPDEVLAGEIRHALGISIPNTSFGPICTSQQLGTNAEGNSCGTALAPASKFEHGGLTVESNYMSEPFKSTYTLNRRIPEGMRFSINLTYEQIDAWVASRSDLQNNPRRAETAKIFARAIRDYGMIVVDTNGSRPDVQMVGGVNPDNAAKWKSLALGPDLGGNDLLKGLINRSNLYVVEPPTVQCADGTTSKNYCKWLSASYGTSTPIPDTTPPTVTVTPPTGSLVGSATLSATATDNESPITSVQFYIDNQPLTPADNQAPYTYQLDTTKYTNGTHKVTAKATTAVFESMSSEVTITIANTIPDTTKPVVNLTDPINGASIPEGQYTIKTTASDNVAVKHVIIKLDGQQVGNPITTAPYNATVTLSAGSHTIEATAVDTSNINSDPKTATITVTSTPLPTKQCDFVKTPSAEANVINMKDLGIILINWRKTVTPNTNGDCTGDGQVTGRDLSILLGGYGK
jgi:hypothetical protein